MIRPFRPSRDATVITVAGITFALGIPLDAVGPSWGQAGSSILTWLVVAWVWNGSTPTHRRELVVCVGVATLGELFLSQAWGIYEYRLGNLPLFVPPGHALVFTTVRRLSPRVSPWLPGIVVGVGLPYVVVMAWQGTDTQGVLWFVVFLGYLRLGGQPRTYAVVFLVSLAIELYGTTLGVWSYHSVEPWFGLTTTNPPVGIGAIYATLDVIVRFVVPSAEFYREPSRQFSLHSGNHDKRHRSIYRPIHAWPRKEKPG